VGGVDEFFTICAGLIGSLCFIANRIVMIGSAHGCPSSTQAVSSRRRWVLQRE
jgi:hypothetical protein